MIERRNYKRFEIDWDAQVDYLYSGESLTIEAAVRNISSHGALLSIPQQVDLGSQLNVYVKLPMRNVRWMKYSGRVLRVDNDDGRSIAAVKFDRARPEFRQ